eukprot:COSAG02_NODE_23611_length_713_cov_0.995114_2_plen_67_part_01
MTSPSTDLSLQYHGRPSENIVAQDLANRDPRHTPNSLDESSTKAAQNLLEQTRKREQPQEKDSIKLR